MAAYFLSWSSGVAAFLPGAARRFWTAPSRHKGAEAGLHECEVSIRWLAPQCELQLRTSAVGWCGGMPGVYSGIMPSQGVPFGRLHVLLSLTFSIQYPLEGPVKYGTPAQNVCYPLPCCGCMSSKLDFRGVDKAFGQERVRYWGILQRKIRLSECTELGFVDFPGS